MTVHAAAWNKDPRDVVFRPIVSEKSYTLIDQGKYTFEVDPRATKTEIKLAIEKIFKVKVSGVNTLNKTGKNPPHQVRSRKAQRHQACHCVPVRWFHRHLHGCRLGRK